MLTGKRKRKNGIRLKLGMVLVCAYFMSAVVCFQAWSAQTQPDIGTESTLTIICRSGEDAVAGTEFSLYQVAEISEQGEYTLTGDFLNCPVDLKNGIGENQAKILSDYVSKNEIAVIDFGRTDGEGKLRFPCARETMDCGMYLVVGEKHVQNGKIYTVASFLTEVPEWMNVTVYPKFASRSEISENGDRDSNGGTIVPGTTAASFENPILVEELNVIEEAASPLAGFLPRTGQLWWLVPMLAGAGILCVLAGIILRKN